jgi:hypothetical protein
MKIYVSPISGGFFPNQLGNLFLFPEPDLFLGSSGGNLANYLYCSIKSRDLLNSIPELIPSIGINKESTKEFLQNIVYTTGPTEKITLVHDKNSGKAQLFSNRDRSNSLFQNLIINEEISSFNSMNDIIYNNMNIKKITKSIQASYSIPNDTVIYGNQYDGEICYASPLTPLKYYLYEMSPQQIIYFSPFNTDKINETLKEYPIYEKEILRTNYLILSDRSHGLDFLKGKRNIRFTKCSISDFHQKYSHKKCFVIVQPLYNKSLNIFDFNGVDVEEIMKSAQNYHECLVWFVE